MPTQEFEPVQLLPETPSPKRTWVTPKIDTIELERAENTGQIQVVSDSSTWSGA